MKQINFTQHITLQQVIGKEQESVRKVCFDSRLVGTGDLFVALKGTTYDGHSYIDSAVNQGAVVVFCEKLPNSLSRNVTYVVVKDCYVALSELASFWWGNPSKKLVLVGVTGTNGKTTVSSLLYQLSRSMGYATGLISTIEIRMNEQVTASTHTTPDVWKLNELLCEMVQKGITHVFMEVSSHGIDQQRIRGLCFAGGIFTNLTHDHLDYHKTFALYRDTKKLFFDGLPKTAFALSNADDKNGAYMLQNTKAQSKMYALKTIADYQGKILEYDINGMWLEFSNCTFWSFLIGKFNAYNLLAVYAAALQLGWNKQEVLIQMSKLKPVSGRFQYYVSEKGVTAIVDYAHTPDALQNVLKTIDQIRKGKNSRIITVVGCGGNRDRQKRPKMAEIAVTFSDEVILTSDNPRGENPEDIIDEMEKGVLAHLRSKVLRITDRKQALQTSAKLSQKGDIILVAGKGHETYQEISGIKYEFDDFKWITKFLNQ